MSAARGGSIRILVANPNRVPACTALIGRTARAAAGPGTVITTVAPARGPVELDGPLAVQLSAVGVLERIAAHRQATDAVVLAGFGEPGLEAARDLLGRPVLDITECGPALALSLGRRYAVVTSTHAAVPGVEDRLAALGLLARCAAVTAVGLSVPAMLADRAGALGIATTRIEACAARPGVDAVVLGCGGLSGLAAELGERTGVPVVDPVVAAVTTAEALVRLRPSTGRASSRREPPEWPLFPVHPAQEV